MKYVFATLFIALILACLILTIAESNYFYGLLTK
jgi:hypothetical protein